MKTTQRITVLLVLMTLFASLGVQLAMSQDTGRRGDRGERRRFDPAQMMDRMMERHKESLGVTDEEWKVIEPRLKNVLDARMETRMGGFGRWRGDSQESDSEAEALRKALESEESSSDDIKAKLTAFRDAQKKKEEALQKAREELRKVLTIKQEARLVLDGVLD